MREKLIELLKRTEYQFTMSHSLTVENVADDLIQQGVTIVPDNNVGEWIPVTERLPDLIPCNAGTAYSEAVIVWTDGRKAMIAVWDGIDFLCAADYWEAWGETITHWMPLPEPPKGDSI